MMRFSPRRAFWSVLLLAALAGVLDGCVTYQSRALPKSPDLATSSYRLTVDPARLRVAPLVSIVIDPSDGFSPLEAAVLAVLNNPGLAAKRRTAGVNEAQVFLAGLLPDPQITASTDKPFSGPDHNQAYGLGAGFDLSGLMAAVYGRRAARQSARQVDLDLLWAEWSISQQARQQAETVLAVEARAGVLRKTAALADDRYQRSSRELRAHDAALQTNAADLAVALDAKSQLLAAEHDARRARGDLNALIGLRADVVLPLASAPATSGYDAAAVARALATLPDRRPDLLALKAGYAAQDATLRKAILAQFPLNNLAANYARDPAGTTTGGLALAFALPIFNGGRGEARVQTATREQLRAEYQARLDQTDAEVRGADRERADARRAVAALDVEVPRLERLIEPAIAAYDRHDLDSQTYLTLSQAALSKRGDLDDKVLAARLAEIALETALFLPPAETRIAP
jgi:cobalt-zinc-cadmium efflux system outer membrane protein